MYKFTFAPDIGTAGYINVDMSIRYSRDQGYGFQGGGQDTHSLLPHAHTGEYFHEPVPTFVCDVPNGTYRVIVELGDDCIGSETTVKASFGRLMLYKICTLPGELISEQFAIQVTNGQLTLAFGGARPKVQSFQIVKDSAIARVFLAGDSTVADRPSGRYPLSGWGQVIPKFFTGEIAVVNEASSGRSSKSFISEGRLHAIRDRIRPGDYLFVQFGHNDEKTDERGTEPYSSFQEYLTAFIEAARQKGARPILISPVHRRSFGEDGKIRDTHGHYVEAVRELAFKTKTSYLDLASTSKTLFNDLGEERTKAIFMWAEPNRYRAYPDGIQDDTHFQEYGAIQVADLVAGCIRTSDLIELKSRLRGNCDCPIA